MTTNDGNWWQSRWRHVRLAVDSPDVEISPGVHARIAAMTGQIMVVHIRMSAGAAQEDSIHEGETVISILDGGATIGIGDEEVKLAANEVAVIPAGERYSLVAGDAGCLRIDVFSPPNSELAEAAFHEEHANHGFE